MKPQTKQQLAESTKEYHINHINRRYKSSVMKEMNNPVKQTEKRNPFTHAIPCGIRAFCTLLLVLCIVLGSLTACVDPETTTTTTTTSLTTTAPGGVGPAPGGIASDPDFQNYSPALQTVLTGSYYTKLIEYLEETYHKPTQNDRYQLYHTIYDNYCQNIPYGFLAERGYNVDAIKRSTNDACRSEIYILDDEPNNLYINCAVLNKSSIDYYDIYLLKYTLTAQEKTDLDRLFCAKNNYNRISLYQAPLFVQELTYQKDAQVLKTGYMEANTFQKLRNTSKEEILNQNSGNNTSYAIVTPTSSASYENHIYNNTLYGKFIIEASFVNMDVITFTQRYFTNSYNQIKGIVYSNVKVCTNSKLSTDTDNIDPVYTIDGKNVIISNNGCQFNQDNINLDNSNLEGKKATFYDINDYALIDGTNAEDERIMRLVDNKDAYLWLHKELS